MHLSPLVQVIDQFAISHQTTFADLTSHSTKQPLARWRQELYYLCFMDPSKPTCKAIGRRLNRDHSTVMTGIRRHCVYACLPIPSLSRHPGRPKRALEMVEGHGPALTPYSAPAAFSGAAGHPQVAAELEQEA